jgi:hypothetical protein
VLEVLGGLADLQQIHAFFHVHGAFLLDGGRL